MRASATPRRPASAGCSICRTSDGGMPTFCRGWTGLPFDRSGPDLTAHAVRAWCAWRPHLASPVGPRIGPALDKASRYLARVQHVDGAFAPLWFGNEAAPGEVNLTYGTAKVLPALDALADAGIDGAAGMADRAARWLAASQRPDGGWSGCVGPTAGADGDRAALDRGDRAGGGGAGRARRPRSRRGSGARPSRPGLAADRDPGRLPLPRRADRPLLRPALVQRGAVSADLHRRGDPGGRARAGTRRAR